MRYSLYERIGDPVLVLAPAAHATDIAATDNTAGVPIDGAQGVLFLLTPGVLTGDSVTMQINYSSTGSGSDASASTTVWAASDAAFSALNSDGENELYMLDLDLEGKGLDDEAGKLYVTTEAVGDGIYSVIGIPYNLKRLPATNANTVIDV